MHHEQTNSSSMNDHQVLKKLAGVHFCSTSTRKGISKDGFQDFMNQLDRVKLDSDVPSCLCD